MTYPKHKAFTDNFTGKLKGSFIWHIAHKKLADLTLSSSADANLDFVHFLQAEIWHGVAGSCMSSTWLASTLVTRSHLS